tara:strand:+ start:202 stop:444 length:243 start_codon:yes stop_codon:yes gene_type:complete
MKVFNPNFLTEISRINIKDPKIGINLDNTLARHPPTRRTTPITILNYMGARKSPSQDTVNHVTLFGNIIGELRTMISRRH